MPLLRLAAAALCSLCAAALARAEFILQAPAEPIPAGTEFALTLVVTNATGAPATVAAPAALPLVACAGDRVFSVVFHPAVRAETAATPLAPGTFRRVAYVGRLPENLSGLVVLDATDSRAGRAVVTLASVGAPPPAPDAAEPTMPPPRREFGISPHEPIYFAAGGKGGLNARFQLSFKFRPIGPSDDRIAGRGFWEDFYVSYTQTSLWDLHSLSKPFTDSSYRPAFFYHHYDTGARLLGASLGYAGGFEHESNGKAGADSRSINILFARPSLRWGAPDDWQFLLSPKLYWYIEKSENDDIQRFRGYGDFLLALEHPQGLKLAATLRAGTSGRGSVLIDASYPFSKINDLVSLGWIHGYLHLQFFEGWGESLLHYDERGETQFRVGFMALR